MITTKKLLPLFWAALIMLALAACGGASSGPAAEPSVETETPKSIQTEFESGGLRLRVPEEYAGLVTVACSSLALSFFETLHDAISIAAGNIAMRNCLVVFSIVLLF